MNITGIFHQLGGKAGRAISCCGQVWDVGTGQVIRHLKGFGMKVNSLLFAQDSTLMIGGSDDRSVSAHILAVTNTHAYISFVGTFVVHDLIERQVRIWDLRSRENAATDSMSDASGACGCLLTPALIMYLACVLITHLESLCLSLPSAPLHGMVASNALHGRCHYVCRCRGH